MAQAGRIFPGDSAFTHLPLSPNAKIFAVNDSASPALNGWVTVGDIVTASYDSAARLVQAEAAARDTAVQGVVQTATAAALAGALAATKASVLQVVQQTVNAAIAALPPSSGGSTSPSGPLQAPFVIVGRPGAGQVFNVPVALAVQVPADLAGLVVYFDAPATANAVFTLNRISGGTKALIGTVTITAGAHTGYVASHQPAVALAVNDVLQLVCPAPADATLADGGMTVSAAVLPSPVIGPIQSPFVIVGRPPGGQVFNIPMAIAITIPANLAGLVVYFDTPATANALFTLNRIAGGVKTLLGTVSVTAGSHTGYVASQQAAGALAINDVLQLLCPAVADATLADGGITISATRT